MTINVWNALFFLLKYTWSFDECRSQLFCGIGYIWVLPILDPALQINIHIKARSLYLHIIPALRLHLWSLVLIIALLWLMQWDWYLFWDTLNEKLFYGLYHRFSANCRAISVVPASFKFGLKVDLKKGFSEIILPTVRDLWIVRWRSLKKSPKLRQWLHYINVKTRDCSPKCLTQYANTSSSYSWDTHLMCFSFKLFHVWLPTMLHNAPKLINTPIK